MSEQPAPAGRIVPPGRLGDPAMSLGTDPRADPRMVAAMRPLGIDRLAPPLPFGPDAPLEQILQLTFMAEDGNDAAFAALLEGLPPAEGVTSETRVIAGTGGQEITLFIHRPAAGGRRIPGVVHLHGGGMTILTAADATYTRLRDELAATGMVVVGVEFRNAGGKLGPHPFPAGLDDCAAGVRWVHAHRDELGIGKLLVAGESGGGNLTLAVTHRARREGWLDAIDGVYAQCPYISGMWAAPPAELPSLRENDGYFIGCGIMALMARAYDPDGVHANDPECWPYAASLDDLRGMPPHVISVNELDPLRDEGLAYYRRLAAAGVAVTARTVNGTCHAGDLIFAKALPETHAASVRDVKGFADSL
ncbi:alpha/beta hydrolase [Acidiferrimicrobium sp. IK]|uniref:alpha/beta hydrolase n=1 Tax=Acidiferrimicrobium sp. IK TaxID=2871700 RepID=UPI0021CAEF6A|nr:alpha/beta hydrolase [Acidiferrimicrobium sp. IK]MCU4186565.1 alpha/beta hydrolase [Acidiferrimicrobium sp. IK]